MTGFRNSIVPIAMVGLCLTAPVSADTLKDPSSYELSIATPEHSVYVGTTARSASIQFANVALSFPPTVNTVRLYKRIPATSNNGGWVGQVLMSVAPIKKLTDKHYAYCQLSDVQTVSFSLQVGNGPISYTKVTVKDGFAISPPFTFNGKDPTYVNLVSADPVQPPLESAMRQIWHFTKCTIGGSLF